MKGKGKYCQEVCFNWQFIGIFVLHNRRFAKLLLFVRTMEGSNELRKIEKEIIEARGLIIKSNNLANSMSADVRSIAKRQSSYERNLSVSSAVAYLIFAVLAFVAAQLVYNVRHASLEKELAQIEEEAANAKAELAELKKEKGVVETPGKEDLAELYALISEGERQGTIDAFEKVNQDHLTFLEKKLLNDVVREFRGDLSMEHYSKGLGYIEKKKFAEAVEEFKQSLRYKDDAGHAKAAKIELANALRLQGKPREAIAVLQKVIEEHLDQELSDDAMWYLALSHQEAHQKDEARSVLRALMRQYPNSQYYRAARMRAAELQLHLYSTESR